MPPALPNLSKLSVSARLVSEVSEDDEVNAKRRKPTTWDTRPSPSKHVCKLDGEEATQKLLNILKEKMKLNVLLPLQSLNCAGGNTFPRSQQKLLQLLEDNANFERQHCMKFSGGEFHQRMDLNELKKLVVGYKAIWPDKEPDQKDGTWNLDDKKRDEITKLLMERPHMFMPMIHALIDAKYADSTSDFQLLYRFQSLRHQLAAVYHMDHSSYHTYSDDGSILKKWNQSGTRAVVTSACINMSPGETNPTLWKNCGTIVALGVPVLRSDVLNDLMEVVYDEAKALSTCTSERIMRNAVTRHLMDSTEFALIEFQNQGFKLESAGIRELVLENGVISDYNDTMFHKANMDIPENYSRVFFVMSRKNTTAGKSTEIKDEKNGTTYKLFITSI